MALLSGCSTTGNLHAAIDPAAPGHTVILVSLDSFRPAELGHGRTPQLDAIARGGVRADFMRPSYPSLTFPNHYTLVTGLRPDHHGIVQNTMRDPAIGRFTIKNADNVGDARWWNAAEPLWSTAEKAGVRTATMFWPGSTAPIGGVLPGEWRLFDAKFPGTARVDTVLGWLDRPPAARPRFVTLYFEMLDEASHDDGPDSARAYATETELDGFIARLREGIAARGLRDNVDLVVVSDHGMATVPPGHTISIDEVAPPTLVEAVTTGQDIGLQPLPGRDAAARSATLGRHAHHTCWARETLPARWQYGANPRVPPIVCQMDQGWDAESPDKAATRNAGGPRGSHGYDPALVSMRALFIAEGPSFKRGVRVPAFDNVDLYPLLARLIGVTPLPNDGDPRTLRGALRTTH